MYAQLGSLTFEVVGPLTALTARREYSFAKHSTIEGKPRLQYTGDGLEERVLEAMFSEAFCRVELAIAELQYMASRHEAVPLSFANGALVGRYVIQELDETLHETTHLGTVTRASYRIRLLEWAEAGNTIDIRRQQLRRAAPAARRLTQTARVKRSVPSRPASTNPRSAAVGSILRTHAAQ